MWSPGNRSGSRTGERLIERCGLQKIGTAYRNGYVVSKKEKRLTERKI
jgi:hypothetical protein